MFLGQYQYTLDEKNRMTIPARFRDKLEAGFVITRGLDPCLTIYPMPVWEELSQKVKDIPITDPRGRSFRRQFFADALNVTELDKQGRFIVPERLRAYAGLESSSPVIIVGLEHYIEVWNPQRWEEFNAQQLAETDPSLWESLRI